MGDHRNTFKEEAYELITELEASLLELEENPGDADLIGRVFRALHTIKGSGAMFGFDDIAGFTHELEAVFDLVRDEKLPVTKELTDLTLASCDHLRRMLDLDSFDRDDAVDQTRAAQILESLATLVSRNALPGNNTDDGSTDPSSTTSAGQADVPEVKVTYRIRFRPSPNIFATGTNPILLLNELRDLGECRIMAQTDAIPHLHDLNPELCYTYWDIILTTSHGINAIRDVFIFVEHESEIRIEVVDEEGGLDEEVEYKRLGEILVERGDLPHDVLKCALREQKRIGEVLMETGVVDPGIIESALAEQQHVRRMREERHVVESASSIRVPADRLDTLVDLVGELVTVQARLTQTVSSKNDAELFSIAEEVERLTAELRDNTMSLRMVPIGTTFGKFKRLVRDLSAELGKEVMISTEGEETELDKTVIERLNDPLVHLIRNCIDHGIEPPEVRKAIGKPPYGTLHLSAIHSGANVLIRIKDDGAGLDPEVLRAKAVEKGLMTPDAERSERELFALILAPGFSTVKNVTNVSGRGVGMDVVKRSMDALHGSIEISSQKNAGTTITLKLPLTLAIIDGLLAKVGEGYFVLPLSAVEECVELTRQEIAGAHGRHMIPVRGRIVPYLRLREMFEIDGGLPAIEQIVIAEMDSQRIGFVVDKVIGEYQTVIKSLGRLYKDLEGISGATILGDGTVALILDVPRLIQIEEREQKTEDGGRR